MNEPIKTQVIFDSKEPVEKVPDLWNLFDDQGNKYSTFVPDNYPLGNPMFVEYIEVKNKGKNGKVWITRRLQDKREYKPASKPATGAKFSPSIVIDEGRLIVETHKMVKELWDSWKSKQK